MTVQFWNLKLKSIQLHERSMWNALFNFIFLPFIGLDKEMQVKRVHVIDNAVAECSNQVLVVVDFLLWRPNKNLV